MIIMIKKGNTDTNYDDNADNSNNDTNLIMIITIMLPLMTKK